MGCLAKFIKFLLCKDKNECNAPEPIIGEKKLAKRMVSFGETERQHQCSLASQPSLLREFQASERLCLITQDGWHVRCI